MEVFTDVTEITRLQRQLALTGRAVAGTAHRVKNILMGLEGGTFIVNDGLENDDREAIAEGWEMVERNVHRVSAIVKDLLFCAKERTPDFEAGIRPSDIVLEVHNLFAERMAGENIEIHADVSPDCVAGTYDPEAIHSLLCNLVGNAIDACRFDPSEDKESHRVDLRCWQNGAGETIFEVEDNGEGIPEELTHKVFEEFFSSKGVEGTGIGLLVVQKVAEEHGGSVNFTSAPGQGTKFTVTIPPHRPLPVQQKIAGESGEHLPVDTPAS
jgi:signal transduction histidine kinase